MRSTLVIAGFGVFVSVALVLLNPALLINAGIGIGLGLGVRWVFNLVRRNSQRERPETPHDQARGMRRSNRVALLVGTLLACLAFVGAVALGVGNNAGGLVPVTTVHSPYARPSNTANATR